jgi:hypothetical protein
MSPDRAKGGLQHPLPRTVVFLSFLLAIAVSDHRAVAGPRDDFRRTGIVKLMQAYGQPDQIVAAGRGNQDRAYHWRLKTTASFEGPNQSEQDFFCDVTAVVGANGRVKAFAARPADVGAGALASADAFGPLCRKAFGARPRGASSDKLARMRL